jgi:uncharacterized protein (DUF1330 family)
VQSLTQREDIALAHCRAVFSGTHFAPVFRMERKPKEFSVMANAYLVGHIIVKDADKWAEYRNRVPATIAPFGGELVFRGKHAATLSGNSPYTDIVVIRFPDAAALNAWHASAPYQAIVPLREEAAEVVLVSYEE